MQPTTMNEELNAMEALLRLQGPRIKGILPITISDGQTFVWHTYDASIQMHTFMSPSRNPGTRRFLLVEVDA